MNQEQKHELTTAQNELLTFINTTDAPCIAKSLRKVFNMALFENANPITEPEKEALFYLEKVIDITVKM